MIPISQRIRRTPEYVSPGAEGMILALWYSQKLDTFEIAKKLGYPEHEVANRLLTLRQRRKERGFI